MIAYSARPNAYFNERADDVAELYDGFFFTVGNWDEGVISNLGLGADSPPTTDWKDRIRENLSHLREAGVRENLLGVSFGQSAPWPSPKTLLSKAYTEKMARHFGVIGQSARELGFRGVSIDVEYPYKRYELDHEIYTYDGYTPEQLLEAAKEQGRAIMNALLNEYPDAVVFVLPGVLWSRPIERAFQLAMLEVMAKRDAPGGLHAGAERSYSLIDPIAQVAIARTADLSVPILIQDKRVLDYWQRRCTMAPGVWPLHMVETGGKDYPVRPWAEEFAELQQQLRILRAVSKRYVWSYSGQPVWYAHTSELEEKYGLARQAIDGVDEAIPGWHAILRDRTAPKDMRIRKLIQEIEAFDKGKIDGKTLCARFGTPGEWLLLGLLSNPFLDSTFTATKAIHGSLNRQDPFYGRDGVVHWQPFRNRNPLGEVHLRAAFDWFKTDDASVHLASTIHTPRKLDATLWLNGDDGVSVWIDNTLVFDHLKYPERGHGLQYRDRYLFENKIPVSIPKGESRLVVTSVNLWGGWGINLRLTDKDGFPLDGVTFSLPR